MALSSQNRLSLKGLRERFFESGISIYSPDLQMIVLKEEVPAPLFAVMVSKKIAKKAHDRNRLRRQIQSLIQKNIAAFPSFKYLYLPKKPSALITSQSLVESFSQLLSRLK